MSGDGRDLDTSDFADPVDYEQTVDDYEAGDHVLDTRWQRGEGMFHVGVVDDIVSEDGAFVVYALDENEFIYVSREDLPYMQLVGDSYYDKHHDCCGASGDDESTSPLDEDEYEDWLEEHEDDEDERGGCCREED